MTPLTIAPARSPVSPGVRRRVVLLESDKDPAALTPARLRRLAAASNSLGPVDLIVGPPPEVDVPEHRQPSVLGTISNYAAEDRGGSSVLVADLHPFPGQDLTHFDQIHTYLGHDGDGPEQVVAVSVQPKVDEFVRGRRPDGKLACYAADGIAIPTRPAGPRGFTDAELAYGVANYISDLREVRRRMAADFTSGRSAPTGPRERAAILQYVTRNGITDLIEGRRRYRASQA